jgi:hypothetical protein
MMEAVIVGVGLHPFGRFGDKPERALRAGRQGLLATARSTRRGRSVHFAQAQACGAASGKVVATGQVAVSISGERPGAPWPGTDGAGASAA